MKGEYTIIVPQFVLVTDIWSIESTRFRGNEGINWFETWTHQNDKMKGNFLG